MNLSKPGLFFDALRTGLFKPSLETSEVEGLNALLGAMEPWCVAWTAYGLATAYHETAHTMQPVKEYGGEAYFFRMYDIAGNRPQVAKALGNTEPGDGVKFCGRGYVQLTGRRNYVKADAVLELNGALVDDPDLALEPVTAAEILVCGMSRGWFTGLSLASYLPQGCDATPAQFMAARRIINGSDRDALIAGYAMEIQSALHIGA